MTSNSLGTSDADSTGITVSNPERSAAGGHGSAGAAGASSAGADGAAESRTSTLRSPLPLGASDADSTGISVSNPERSTAGGHGSAGAAGASSAGADGAAESLTSTLRSPLPGTTGCTRLS